ncbi:hypothetical protein ACFWZ3_15690 [Frateuria sp. GZRR35]|uniref:hypothetical protein n=1 Tax=Frateuria sp. GZRR35 TaxID=3351536 RepID=UPI003EDC8B9B
MEELLARWALAKIPTLFVEGEFDRRFLRLLQAENGSRSLSRLDVMTPADVNAPAALLAKHAVPGTGEKQRVVAISRELEMLGAAGGFLGVVDRDLDSFLGLNFESNLLSYTDHSCFEVYLWSPESLKHVAKVFKADSLSDSRHAARLYESLNDSCAKLTAVRVVNERRPDWEIKLHRSESSLSLDGSILSLNLPSYVSQCRPVRGSLPQVQEAVAQVCRELAEADPLQKINGHDLAWLLMYALRALTIGPRRSVEEDVVMNSLVALGVESDELLEEPLFAHMNRWAENGN